MNIDGKMKSESFKQKVINCIRAWEDWAMYPNDFLIALQNMFLGLLNKNSSADKKDEAKTEIKEEDSDDNDVDGKPLEDDDDEEVDGKPLDDDEEEEAAKSKFIKSKWEQVDPEQVEKQAITTSKWDFYDDNQANEDNKDSNFNDSLKQLRSYGNDNDDSNKVNKTFLLSRK